MFSKSFFCCWQEDSARGVYQAVVDLAANSQIELKRLAARAPGVGKGYASFGRKRRQLEQVDYRTVSTITIDSPVEDVDGSGGGSIFHVHISQQYACLTLSWIPVALPREPSELESWQPSILRLAQPAYSFRYSAPWDTRTVGLSMFYDPTQAYERFRDHSTRWLHDIFPDNYLNAEYLEAPVGFTGRSLREWIEADEGARGTLRPYTDTLVEWRPPVARIPAIREELYRMGRVFHRAFVEEQNFERGPGWIKPLPNPLYRPDQFAAWEAPDGPIPERFRADSYPVTDDPQRVGLLWFDAIRPREQGQ